MTDIRLRLPLDPPYTVTQAFGENPEAYARFGQAGHNGLDFAVTEGTPVYAAADGSVDRSMFDPGGYGNYVRINHGGYSTLYGHLSRANVTIGNKVRAGDVIGYSGNTGNSTGPHLHFELRDPSKIRAGWPQGAVSPSGYFVASEAENQPIEGNLEVGTDVLTVTASVLNMRLNPSMDGQVIGQLYSGAQVKNVKNPQAGWIKVKLETEFYVWGEYVR